mmetsp:Transcript_21300/g.33125  ORF Transcript_21300/g.33125 Transcript_21300/m.33125 type:complete len:195 (-) Transcript_21300:21-605(-)
MNSGEGMNEPVVFGGSEYGKSDSFREGDDETQVSIDTSRDIVVGIRKTPLLLRAPKASREYPERLKGYVREREHVEFIDDLNEEFEKQLWTLTRSRVVRTGFFLLIQIICILLVILDVVDAYLLYACMVYFIVFLVFLRYDQQEFFRAMEEMEDYVGVVTRRRFRSRGVTYRLGGGTEILKLVISFAPGAEPSF